MKAEIGIEVEGWLIDNTGRGIVEPALYSLPMDEFGFLCEFRSIPSDSPEDVKTSIHKLIDAYKDIAQKFGCVIMFLSHLTMTKDEMAYYATKYNHSKFEDMTANIHPLRHGSHHTGYVPMDNNKYECTSGIHVHFSLVDDNGVPLQLPMFKIVEMMDEAFKDDIERANRMKGEFELKYHHGKKGFEYRSLPCDVDVDCVIDKSFEILNKVLEK